jgi:hypothetical protein
MHELYRIERIIRKGLQSLSDSLYQEWPLPDGDTKNEISEASLSIHVAHALLTEGFCAYGEFRTGRNEHHDLVAFHPDMDEYIVLESKRYLSTDGRALSKDLDRINKSWSGKPTIGVAIVMTRFQEIRNWWLNPKREKKPNGKGANEWQQLHRYLSGENRVIGHVPLAHHGDFDEELVNGFFHEALYLIYHANA